MAKTKTDVAQDNGTLVEPVEVPRPIIPTHTSDEEETLLVVAQDQHPEGDGLPQSVPLEAFCHNQFGAKHLDQAGGFLFWARKQGHSRHTVAEWVALLGEFSNRPVGAQS